MHRDVPLSALLLSVASRTHLLIPVSDVQGESTSTVEGGEALQLALDEAVATENYAEAARLRDILKYVHERLPVVLCVS